MQTTPTATMAVIYLRISLDATGEMLAVSRQRDDCERIAHERGWHVVGEYVDNSVSASDARKNRPGYDALLRDYDEGKFNALLCWDLDRLTRQPRQLEDWIERAEGKGLLLVTANGEADLTSDNGRTFARIKLAVARGEVDRKSARQRAAARQRSDRGKPPLGVRLTGYTTAGELVSDESAVIKRIFDGFAAGESLKSLAGQLNASGVRTRRGNVWNPSTVRTMLTNPRYAGRAVYQGSETGKRGGWEPIVTDDAFALAQARLSDPRRTTNRVGTDRRHLGSGIYRCGACDSPVRSWSGARYRCAAGCHVRSQVPVDDFVLAVIRERLSRPDLRRLLTPSKDAAAPLVSEANALRQRLEVVGQDYDAGHIDGPRYATARAKLTADLASFDRRIVALTSGSGAAATLTAADPVAAFDKSSLMGKRAVIEALAVVKLMPGTRYSRTFDPETVRIEWKGQP